MKISVGWLAVRFTCSDGFGASSAWTAEESGCAMESPCQGVDCKTHPKRFMTSPTLEPIVDSSFVCACEKEVRSACVEEPFYKEREGKRYCLLHYPGSEKEDEFRVAFERKRKAKDYNFRASGFPLE